MEANQARVRCARSLARACVPGYVPDQHFNAATVGAPAARHHIRRVIVSHGCAVAPSLRRGCIARRAAPLFFLRNLAPSVSPRAIPHTLLCVLPRPIPHMLSCEAVVNAVPCWTRPLFRSKVRSTCKQTQKTCGQFRCLRCGQSRCSVPVSDARTGKDEETEQGRLHVRKISRFVFLLLGLPPRSGTGAVQGPPDLI